MKMAEFIRGELTPEEEMRIEKLIATDPKARAEYEEWQEFFGSLALLSRYTHKPKSRQWREAVRIKEEEERYRKKKLITGIGIITGVIGGAATAAAITYLAIRRK
ncbi:hypothetical protein GM182_06715 [bacterium 3DAC]|nr:hypothetical protein GM182_06715 [bacterium 3DAC]